jgi:nucleoside-triphosphatase
VRILLEGRPGSGKSTVVRRLAELLEQEGVSFGGFVTDELREHGRRVGFAVADLAGERDVLAHVELPGPPRVGRYGVDLEAFERVALPALDPRRKVVLVDELGKMELASAPFREAFSEVWERANAVVATVHVFRHPFTDALKQEAEVVRVEARGRDALPRQLAERLRRFS